MKRFIFVCCALMLLGSCARGYKMPKGFEKELRAFYAEWYDADGEHRLSSDEIEAVNRQSSVITQKYGLMEQAVEFGYFTEQQDPYQLSYPQIGEYLDGWAHRNTTAEFQKLIENAQMLTIDEIVKNGNLLPIEKLKLVGGIIIRK